MKEKEGERERERETERDRERERETTQNLRISISRLHRKSLGKFINNKYKVETNNRRNEILHNDNKDIVDPIKHVIIL